MYALPLSISFGLMEHLLHGEANNGLQHFLVDGSNSMGAYRTEAANTIRALTKLLKHRVADRNDVKLTILTNPTQNVIYSLRKYNSSQLRDFVMQHGFRSWTGESTSLPMTRWYVLSEQKMQVVCDRCITFVLGFFQPTFKSCYKVK